MSTIGIIGTGWVGSSVAISTLQSGIASELLLYDIRTEDAEGDAMDLAHGAPFYPAARVRTASIEEMVGADAVVIAAGRGGRPDESRLDLLKDNAAIIRDIGKRLAGSKGLIIVVTNPVDVLVYVMAEASGLPLERVLGTGTMLDTARLRQKLGLELDLDPRSVHAQVIGEHGDSSVVLWSGARVGGTHLRNWPSWKKSREAEIGSAVRSSAYEIIRRKGTTNHAIGLVTAALIRWSLRGSGRRVMTVSRVQDGAMGFRGVALSLPTAVGPDGGVQVIEPEMDHVERQELERSAALLIDATKTVTEHLRL